MKTALQLAIFVQLLLQVGAYGDSKEQVLSDGVRFVRELWAEVIGKGPLSYTKIPQEKLPSLLGTWRGLRLGPIENPEMVLTLKEDETWSSKYIGEDLSAEETKESEMKGSWYLKDGMIVLFKSPVEEGSTFDMDDFASGMILEGGKLWLINPLMPDGYHELEKEPEAEQD